MPVGADARPRATPWSALAIGVAGLILAPLGAILIRLGADGGGVFRHLSETVLSRYVTNTLGLGVGVGLLTLVLGVGTAWLVTMYRFPLRGVLGWALLLPLAIPTYLAAYALTALFEFSGPLQSAIRGATGWTRDEFALPPVRSLGGAIAILAFALYPYVYLAARAAFVEQPASVFESGRLLGLSRLAAFRRLALPLARPSIVAGLALVLMETMAEFGAVDYCAVDTFATGIYRTWRVYGLTPAAHLASALLAAVVLLVSAERIARRRARFHDTGRRRVELPCWTLRGTRGWAAAGACALPVLAGFVIPAGMFVWLSWQGGDPKVARFLEYARNSVVLALLASTLAIGLAIVIGYARRLRPTPTVRTAATLAGAGYAVPGGVVAVGILLFVGGVDRALPTGPLLGGTIVAVVLGYQTRFLAIPLGLVDASLTRIAPSLDDAARTLGAGSPGVLRRVHFPLMRSSLAASALLVFVDVVKELPATLILRPFNFDTLAVRVHHLASDERLSQASTGALAIILVGLIPVYLLSRVMRRPFRDVRGPV